MRRSSLRRLRRSPAAFWVAAVLLAALTGTVVARLVDRAAATAARFGPPRTAVVVRRAVPAGAVVQPGDVALRSVPSAVVPRRAIRSPPIGRRAAQPLLPGQVVVADQLAPDGVSAVAAMLPPGRRAVAVPTGGLSPPLEPGDVVDVVATFEEGDPPTFVVAEGAAVLAVTEDVVTVAVSVDDVAPLAFAVARGVVTVVVAPPP